MTINNPTENLTGKIFASKMELIKFYSDKLLFIWDKWLTVVHLLIGLSGATILLFLNLFNIFKSAKVLLQKSLMVLSIICAILALLSGILWRFMAQHFMENDVLGPKRYLLEYFKILNIKRGVSYGPITHIKKFVVFQFILYYLSFHLCYILLITSWVLGLFFVIKNF